MKHHPNSPSKFPAWNECACYDGEIVDADEDNDANAGTRQHEAHAKIIAGVHDWQAGLSSREQSNAEWVAETITETARSRGYGPHEIKCEQMLTYVDDDFNTVYFGTCDAVYGPAIDDAKYGLMRDYFPQFCAYSLAKMQADGSKRVLFDVVYGMLRKVKNYVIDFETAKMVVDSVLAKRNDPDRKPTPCQWCSMCANKANCSAFLGRGLAVIPAAQQNLPIENLASLPEALRLGVMRYVLSTYIEPWGDILKKATVEPVGYHKSQRIGRAYISDTVKAVSVLKESGVSDDYINQALSISMTAIVDAFRKQYPSAEEKEAKQEIESRLAKAGCVARGESYTVYTKTKDTELTLRNELTKHNELTK